MGQEIVNSTNFIMSRQFVQIKFVQEFVAISLLYAKIKPSQPDLNLGLITFG